LPFATVPCCGSCGKVCPICGPRTLSVHPIASGSSKVDPHLADRQIGCARKALAPKGNPPGARFCPQPCRSDHPWFRRTGLADPRAPHRPAPDAQALFWMLGGRFSREARSLFPTVVGWCCNSTPSARTCRDAVVHRLRSIAQRWCDMAMTDAEPPSSRETWGKPRRSNASRGLLALP